MKLRLPILSFLLCFLTAASWSQNIEFVENKGQWDNRVAFMGQVSNGAFFLEHNGFTVVQHNANDMHNLHTIVHDKMLNGKPFTEDQKYIINSHAYTVSFKGANPKPRTIPDKPLFSVNNYMIGNDPSKWASGCHLYQAVTQKDVYPNIDVRYYTDKGTLKYDFIVRPGGNPADIKLHYDGASRLFLKNKELVIATSVGDLRETEPITYQYGEAGRVNISAKYVLQGQDLSFSIKDYNPAYTLVIDPTLIFCSFSGATADNWGFTATYGPDGSMFGGGIVFGEGFPVTPGAFQTTYGGGRNGNDNNEARWSVDIGIIKLSSDGSQRIYATYIGGSSNEMPQSLVVDGAGNLVVAGRSDSDNFPLYPANTPLIGVGGRFDIILTRLNPSGAPLASRKIGGSQDDGSNITNYGGTGASSLQRNYGDEGRSEVILDGAGNVYLASATRSGDFPVQAAFQTSNGGLQDGVVLKFNSTLSTLQFATYVGGNGDDATYVLALDPNGNIYAAGGTASNNLPGTAGTISPGFNGAIDGFITVLGNNGAFQRLTYIGTGSIDQIFGIQFDQKGFPYIMGQTNGTMSVINAQWSQPNGRQFIAKLRPDLSNYVYRTTFGKGSASPDISPVAFLVDRCENVYVSGWGGKQESLAFPNAGVDGLPVTPGAIKSSPDIGPTGTGQDFYFIVLKRDAVSQLYGSFFGQNGGYVDHVDGGTSRFDSEGVIYQAICADCGGGQPYPTTPGVWAPTKPGSANCNLAMVKIAFNLAGVSAAPQSLINGVPRDTAGCLPLTVDFRDTMSLAVTYEWDFGDGGTAITTTPQTSHTYTSVGTFNVRLIAVDSNTCNIRDTAYINIKVGINKALVDLRPVKLNPCDSFKYRFDNTSVAPSAQPFTGNIFTWDFGDGSPRVVAPYGSVFHNYASAGTYNVKLFLNDTAYCNSPDSMVLTIRVAVLVKALFQAPATACAPFNFTPVNESEAGSIFTWDFGDGSAPVTGVQPTHIYTVPGIYTITLVAVDSGTCNIRDSIKKNIQVFGDPTAAFTFSPTVPVENVPISFTNQSSTDAIRFIWRFGDGDSLETTSRAVVQHEYNSTNTFQACLTAFNQAGCADTVCAAVSTLIRSAVDVPNAFTPLQAGANSIVYVRGFGIAKMRFRVYARWGEMVFETQTKHEGWNGYYKGKLLPMDVYAYTLEVEFSDGTKTTKTGDITLIR